MSNTQFLFDYLPSFYRNFMVDENGDNLLLPIFDIYYNSIGDSISQAQQIAMVPFIESCNPIIIEMFSTIDVTIDNKYKDGYVIDSNIIKIEGLFLDGKFTKNIIGTFQIKHDISKNIRYIVFSDSLPITQSFIFIKKIYRDKQILQNVWGNLIGYVKQIPDYNNLSNDFIIDYNNIRDSLELYKKQLLALLLVSMKGPTVYSLINGLGIFIGLEYAPFDGIIINKISNSITIESVDRLQTYTANCIPNINLDIGSELKKYELLEQPLYSFYDILNNPAAFTQILLTGQANKYLNLLNINENDQEKYAHLTFDSTINFDDANIYWDMGNGTGLVKDLTGTSIIDPLNVNEVTRFDTWVSPLFDNQKLYEMFRNLFIVYINNSNIDNHYNSEQMSLISYYLNKTKPIWTKYIIEEVI